MATTPLLDRIGHTPLARIEGVWVKLECANPMGSVKDRLARFLLVEAMRRGELRPGDTVVEATSGNTGIALAAVARELGLGAIVFMPEHMSVERIRMMRALGAEVRLTPREGSFAGAVAERNRFLGRAGHYVPDQFGNPDNIRCHQTTTGPEIIRQLRERGAAATDAFVAGVGTGGTLMGVGLALREVFPRLELVAVEPAESNVLCGKAAGEHGIQGIGDGFIPDLVDRSAIDAVETMTTEEAHAEARRIHSQHGYCVGVSSGANMLAARRLAARGLDVVTVWADCSDRYLSMGLDAPASKASRCPLHHECSERMAELLAHGRPGSLGCREA